MAKLTTENLFLLEFLIDELKMDKCDCMHQGEVCVSFQFLDNQPLDVCEGDFNCDNKFGENNNNKTGKSCLFSLTPTQAKAALKCFDVTVNVYKQLSQGCQPDRICIGTARVSVLPIFTEIISNIETASACAKVLQETYNLLDTNCCPVGKIGVYIRMSCYGKMIVTQFQMNMDDKSVLFKDKDGHSLYRYKKSKKGKNTRIEDLSCKPCRPPPPPPPSCFDYITEMNQNQMNQMNQMGQMNQLTEMNPQMMFGQSQYPPPNPNCPMQPCFPPNGGGQQFPPPNMNCPMQPCFPPPSPPPNLNCPMQPCFPPPNMNCPMQPCFPDYGASTQDMSCPPPPRACQQVSFAGQQSKPRGGGCGGGCCGR